MDAAADADAGGPSTCDSVDASHALCWDMSAHVDGGPDGFVSSTVIKGGSATLSPEIVQSPPLAGRVSTGFMGGGTAHFEMVSEQSWKHVRFSASFFLDHRMTLAELMRFAFAADGPDEHWFTITSRVDSITLSEYWVEDGGSVENRTLEVSDKRIRTGRWTRLALDVELGSPGLVHLFLDDVELAQAVLGTAAPLRPRRIRAAAGTLSAGGDTRPIFIDDMLVEKRP